MKNNNLIKGKNKNGKGKKIMLWLGLILLVVLSVSALLHATLFKNKLEQINPYGRLVDVFDGQMHVYTMGSAEKTLVLLPGMGVSLPSAEFGPLMRKLSQEYTVVSVEYFGMGFSSQTARPRTAENYVEEIRAALNAAGFTGPYVLMPHSISSVYSEYYAAKYPEEVLAILSLDGTSTAYYEETPAFVKSLLKVAILQQASGLSSLIGPLLTKKADLLNFGYTEKEINDMIVFSGFTLNNTSLEQIGNSADFIKETQQLPYPQDIPYFKVISRQTYETSNPQLKKAGITPQEYQTRHLERIGPNAQSEILDGSHFIYANNVDRITQITEAFVGK